MGRSLVACVICAAPLQPWAVVNGYHIFRCSKCGHGQVSPTPTPATLREFYETQGGGHAAKTLSSLAEVVERERIFPNSTVDASRVISFASRFMPAHGRLLDVGCGYGFFSKRARQEGLDVDALEIAGFERRCARAISGVDPIPSTFEDFEAASGSYDAVLMSQVLEHAADVNLWVKKAYAMLRPGGVLCIAVPNYGSFVRRLLRQRDPYITPPAHLNYFTPRSLAWLLRKHSFRLIRLHTISRIPYDVLSKRMSRWPYVSPAMRLIVAQLQGIPLKPLDTIRLGMFINVYATR